MPHKTNYKMGQGKKLLEQAMSEVHKNVPMVVEKTGKTGKAKEKMLIAVAYSKARQAGARLPHKGSTRAWGR